MSIRKRLASLSLIAVAATVALFAGASAYPSDACAALRSEAPPAPAAVDLTGTCGQEAPIYSWDDTEPPIPKRKLSVENTGAKCSLSVKYLTVRGHAWKTEAVPVGGKIERNKKFTAIVVTCVRAGQNDPCSATITVA